ncbi:MAG TPA: TetR/AcrR family transcriptional regulator [Actinocrinis sp.]|uniref:TetR/AcrR family transcriptional regulator n=1 Tax=Actinocrinis sp. TaxID=1920516 RepID=UPI002DDCA20A|nr:TetR/AcrR family transcriptional regulator [Actinocrinis sp.]HEV2343985.1 TetR/AcrR family transcriptional regulator [Actinocrinis sp.]
MASVSGKGSHGLEDSGKTGKVRERRPGPEHAAERRASERRRLSEGRPAASGPEEFTRPGRPRSPDADEAILAAARRLLAERGWDGMTLGDVAAHAGVAKTTLYRRWSGKADLVVDAMAQLFDTLQPCDAGSVRADAEATIRDLIALLALPETQAAVLALAAHAVRDPRLRDDVRDKIVDRSRRLVREGAVRAAERGEQNAKTTDPDLLFDIIVGTIVHRMLIAGEPVDEGYLKRFLDAILPGTVR